MAEPYAVAIGITAKDGVSGVLKNIAAAAFGLSGLEGLKIAEGFERAHAKTVFAAALPEAERLKDMNLITAGAWKESGANLRTEITGNIEAIHDLYNVVQNVPEAIALLPAFNVLKNALDSVRDTVGGVAGETKEIASAVRAFDLAGRNTAESLKQTAELFATTEYALRGRITGGQLLTQVQSAGTARLGWNDEFLTQGFPVLMALGLGNRAGNTMSQFFNNLYMGGGGSLSSKMRLLGQELYGLHIKADELTDAAGHFKGFRAGSVFEAEKLKADPIAWSTDYLAKLTSLGVDVSNESEVMKVVGTIGKNNKLLMTAFAELLLPKQHAQLLREMHNIGNVSPDAAGIIKAGDPRAAHEALAKKFTEVYEAIGEYFVQPMIDNILRPLTGVLRDISQWAKSNPDTVKGWGIAIAGISGIFAILGSAKVAIALAGFVPGGPAILAIAGIAAGIALLGHTDWKTAWSQITTGADGALAA